MEENKEKQLQINRYFPNHKQLGEDLQDLPTVMAAETNIVPPPNSAPPKRNARSTLEREFELAARTRNDNV